VVANGADRDYVLGRINAVLRSPLDPSDVVGVFAGLRPLVAAGVPGGDTTRLSRSHRLFAPLPGLTAIAGGKYTTYRVMARDAVDAAMRDLGGGSPSVTHNVPLLGAEPSQPAPDVPEQAELVRRRHGACAAEVLAIAAADAELSRPIAGAERYLRAEAVHAVTHQGARDLDDVLARRTRIALEVPDQGRSAASDVAPFVARALGWSPEQAAERVARYVRLRDAEAAALEERSDAGARSRYADVLRSPTSAGPT